mmetsp:Transcript_1587/g.5518  ORF Transcript_1587/g.5518 Transcript_1587/m.5518 type:complete len:147 (-) Transcript_1587:2479-2919(-)
MWNEAADPRRTLYQALVQCSVGMVHLLTTNHRGAMLEFGEGVRKLERLHMSGELAQFREDMLQLQEFVYSTQIEYAACDETECHAMTGDEESYERLGDFGKGSELYSLVKGADEGRPLVIFRPPQLGKQSVVLPFLKASEDDLNNL